MVVCMAFSRSSFLSLRRSISVSWTPSTHSVTSTRFELSSGYTMKDMSLYDFTWDPTTFYLWERKRDPSSLVLLGSVSMPTLHC